MHERLFSSFPAKSSICAAISLKIRISFASATKGPGGSSAPSPTLRRQGQNASDRKVLMRTTRENPSEAPMAIMRDPDQPWQPTRGKAKAQANQEQSYLPFTPPPHRARHWPVQHSPSTPLQNSC